MEKVKVRFAPSPTGYLHIGSARTALFNWLYARHTGGKFILRIEDTDLERSKDEFLQEILDSLKWLGLDWDEGPFFQTKRLDIYREFADKLLKEGKAYLADANAENAVGEGRAIILKMPPEKIIIDDLVHGKIEFDAELIKDQVLVKSNGVPTYNFAVVIDDATMDISHVIRGDDHISNTPKQMAIYSALGLPMPKFAHIPLILGADKSRMSKRHGATSIGEYRNGGFLPDAMVNFLSLLGWSPGDDKEIMTIKEIIERFELSNVNKTSAVFDMDKLKWVNGMYIRSTAPEHLCDLLKGQIKEDSLFAKDFNREKFINIIKLFKERAITLNEFLPKARIFFVDKVEFAEGAKEKYLSNPKVKEWFDELIKLINSTPFEVAGLESEFRALTAKLGIKTGELVHPTRVALTGSTTGAGLFETMHLLGKETVIKRLNEALVE